MADGDIVLGANQYGKAECRLVRITRDTDRARDRGPQRHLAAARRLRRPATPTATTARSSPPTPRRTPSTPSPRSTASARPRQFLLTLGRHFVDDFAWVSGGRWEAEQFAWAAHPGRRRAARPRLRAHRPGDPHHRRPARRRHAPRRVRAQGLHGAEVDRLGVPRLPARPLHHPGETDDRILATSITAWWRYADAPDIDFNGPTTAIRSTAARDLRRPCTPWPCSRRIFAVGKAVLEAIPEVAEVKLSCPTSTTSWSTWRRSAWTTPARSSSPPTAPTA